VIVFLGTGHHSYTHDKLSRSPLSRSCGFRVRVIGYQEIWRKHRLPRATYVFTDADRLGFWELELAARLYRELARAGVRVLNDPGRAMSRLTLLRTLRREGLNHFDAWHVDEAPQALPYPVFLRTNSAHRSVLSELLHGRTEVDQAVRAALERGVPRRELILVQYRAEPVRPGLFHKRAMFRVGARLVPSLGVFQSHWCAKHGELGVAGEALYEAENAALQAMAEAPSVQGAFDLAHVDYGRADYGVVDGRVEIYEINTNPMVPTAGDHPFSARRDAGRQAFARYMEALGALDEPLEGPPIALQDEMLARQRKLDRWMTFARWSP